MISANIKKMGRNGLMLQILSQPKSEILAYLEQLYGDKALPKSDVPDAVLDAEEVEMQLLQTKAQIRSSVYSPYKTDDDYQYDATDKALLSQYRRFVAGEVDDYIERSAEHIELARQVYWNLSEVCSAQKWLQRMKDAVASGKTDGKDIAGANVAALNYFLFIMTSAKLMAICYQILSRFRLLTLVPVLFLRKPNTTHFLTYVDGRYLNPSLYLRHLLQRCEEIYEDLTGSKSPIGRA